MADKQNRQKTRTKQAVSADVDRADMQICHSKHPMLAHLNDLATAAGRQARSQFLAEGLLLVQRALEDRLAVDCIVYTSDLLRQPEGIALLEAAASAGIHCYSASEGLLGKVTSSRPVPDVMAPVSVRLASAISVYDEFAPDAHTILIAENINNPDNLGMILRTADAGGARQVVVSGADPYHKNCVRAARGAVGRLAIYGCDNLPTYIEFLKERGVCVVGTALNADHSLYNTPLTRPIAIVVGNENSGITREALDVCSLRIRIPMAAGQDSLNVGVAAGVMLYEVWRQNM